MKKRAWMLALLLSAAIAVAGCTQKTTEEKDTDSKTEETSNTEETEEPEGEDTSETEEETKTTAELMAEVDVEKCVTLGEYKGISVENETVQVTDDDVEKEIQTALAKYPVAVDRAAEVGDTVNINYVGTIEGEEFEGGSAQGSDLLLGSGQFIDGFETGLIGASKGETRTLDLTFPDQYTKDLAGKAVQFTVTINEVKTPLEEASDEWVAANIEGYYTLESYKDAIRSEQEENNAQTAEDQMRYNAWMQVVDGSTINEYPEILVDMGRKIYKDQAEMYAKYNGMELEAFLESSGMTQEQYETNADEYGKSIAARTMVCQAIANAEGMSIGDEGYQEEMQKMLAEYGTTEEELIKAYGQDNVEQSIMLNRIGNMIMENAVIVEKEAEGTEE